MVQLNYEGIRIVWSTFTGMGYNRHVAFSSHLSLVKKCLLKMEQ